MYIDKDKLAEEIERLKIEYPDSKYISYEELEWLAIQNLYSKDKRI